MTKNKKGFTLIELMVVMAIIAVLAVLMIGAIQLARRTATETTNRSNAKTIQTGMEGYFAKNKKYPVVAAGSDLASVVATLGITKLSDTCDNAAETLTGGGLVESTTTKYTITPYNWDCTAALGASDILEN